MNLVPAPDNIWNESCRIAFKIGNLSVAWYAIFVFLGFAIGILAVILKLWKWYKVPVDPFYWFCVFGIITSILGGRFWSCCIGDAKWESFWQFNTGGMAIEGGVVLTLIFGIIYFPLILKKTKYHIRDRFSQPIVIREVSVSVYFDAIVPAVLIGHFIGRWGNYFNQELYGAVVTSDSFCWWLHDYLPWMYIVDSGQYHQPLFLYESLCNGFFFLILYFGLEFIKPLKSGDLGFTYFIWYGILRLCLEPLREQIYSFQLTYVLSALFIVFGIISILLNHLYFTKHRDLKFFLFIKEKIRIFYLSNYYKAKIKILFKKAKQDKKQYQSKLNWYENKLKNLIDYKNKELKNIIYRKDHEVLYYNLK